MAEPETSPELMRAIEVLSRLPPPPRPPPGSTWTRFAAALPPDDGTPFEARFDDEPGARYFVSRRREERRPWSDEPSFDVTGAAFKRAGNAVDYNAFCGIGFCGDPISPETAGWWRLLPADDPPPVPPDAA